MVDARRRPIKTEWEATFTDYFTRPSVCPLVRYDS